MTGGRTWIPYCGAAPAPAELLARWNFDPALLAVLAVAAVLLWRRSVTAPSGRGQAAALFGMYVLLFVSPFCALSSALFSARVTHHVLLTAAAAPLIASLLPLTKPAPFRSLALWTAVQAVIFWAWHSPTLYAAAMSSDMLYWAMQATLLTSAVGFWLALRLASPPAAVAALLVTMVQMGLLGAVITFAGSALYAPHFSATAAWGLAPLEDQQLAGLIMWVPSAGVYLAAALALANRWLRVESRAVT